MRDPTPRSDPGRLTRSWDMQRIKHFTLQYVQSLTSSTGSWNQLAYVRLSLDNLETTPGIWNLKFELSPTFLNQKSRRTIITRPQQAHSENVVKLDLSIDFTAHFLRAALKGLNYLASQKSTFWSRLRADIDTAHGLRRRQTNSGFTNSILPQCDCQTDLRAV